MEKPDWVKNLENKILEIAKVVSTNEQFWTCLVEYCNCYVIAIDAPKQLQENGRVVFLAQKTDEVGIPSSLQVLKMEEAIFRNIS